MTDKNGLEDDQISQSTPNTVAKMLEHDDPVVYARLMELIEK